MKKTELQERISAISAQAAKENKGTLGEARMLFDELSKEARRQAEIEQEDRRHRSLFVKTLLALTLISVCAAAFVGGYGIYYFPDAPVRQKGDAYVGRRGKIHTRESYERFVIWQKALFASFGSTFFFAFAFGIMDSREKRRRKSLE